MNTGPDDAARCRVVTGDAGLSRQDLLPKLRAGCSSHPGGTKFSDTSTALATHWCGLGAVLVPSQAENPHPSATSKARMRASKSLAWWRFTPGLKWA